MKTVHKCLLEYLEFDRSKLSMTNQDTPSIGGSKAGEDSTRQGDANTLTHHASGRQETRRAPLLLFRRDSHQCAIIGRLKQRLACSRQYEPPDNIQKRTLSVQLTDEDEAQAGRGQPSSRQPACPDAVRQHPTEWGQQRYRQGQGS